MAHILRREGPNVIIMPGRDEIWKSMMYLTNLSGSFSRAEVVAKAMNSREYVHRYLKALIKAGYAEQLPVQPKRGTRFRVIRTQISTPRVRADGTDLGEPINVTLWRTMRMLKTFTAPELCAHASLPERPVKLTTAAAYLCHLEAAGLLTILAPGQRRGAKAHRRFGLIGTPGGQAPRVLKADAVYDPNTGNLLSVSSHDAEAC
ncbi:MAG: hypothetical protein KGQ46_12315 [Hyphomicrobiales bacterium]|nr:hypothetical protein [Hyphomicrobiales bacterium]MDE2113856.1 hypothetical protein [Hyphomicrobiales bacterium]